MAKHLLLSLVVGLLWSGIAYSAYDPVSINQELLLEFSNKSQAAISQLRSEDPADWTQAEIDEYLFSTLHAVYYALNLYIMEHDQHPNSAQQLKDSGLLNPWPLNPFNNWEEVTWTTGNIEFSAGDIVIQLCPPDWYSRPNPPRPITYAISIFGPTREYVPLHEKETSPFETLTWAVEPEGAVYSTGFMKGAAKK